MCELRVWVLTTNRRSALYRYLLGVCIHSRSVVEQCVDWKDSRTPYAIYFIQRVFQNKELRRTFGLKRDKVQGRIRELPSEDLRFSQLWL
jgi:hypothetical protein